MARLCEKLEAIKTKDKLQFIDTATVPVIKLIIDLQRVRERITKTSGSDSSSQGISNLIPSEMRYLGIDITFEDAYN